MTCFDMTVPMWAGGLRESGLRVWIVDIQLKGRTPRVWDNAGRAGRSLPAFLGWDYGRRIAPPSRVHPHLRKEEVHGAQVLWPAKGGTRVACPADLLERKGFGGA